MRDVFDNLPRMDSAADPGRSYASADWMQTARRATPMFRVPVNTHSISSYLATSFTPKFVLSSHVAQLSLLRVG